MGRKIEHLFIPKGATPPVASWLSFRNKPTLMRLTLMMMTMMMKTTDQMVSPNKSSLY